METELKNKFTAVIKPTLSVRNGAAAVEFYKTAFDAAVLMQITSPDGDTVAELSIGGAEFYVADESPEYGNSSPESLGGISIRLGLLVDDPDAVVKQAIAAGATEIHPVADQDYGMRLGRIADPFGHHWEIYRRL
jgi:PhnB protein